MTRLFVVLASLCLIAASCGTSAGLTSLDDPTTLTASPNALDDDLVDNEDDDRPDESLPTPVESATPSAASTADSSSALAAVEAIVESVNAGDPLGVLATLDPAERELLSRLYASGLDAAEEQWPHFGGDSAFAAIEPFLGTKPLSVEQLSDHLAWVSTEEIAIDLHAPTNVAASMFWDSGPWLPSHDQAITIDDIDLFGEDHVPGLVVVQIDGEWYVSLVRTFAEYVRRGNGLPAMYSDSAPAAAVPDTASPEAAVAGLFSAIDAGEWADVRSHLVAPEAAAFADYEPTLEHWWSNVRGDISWSVAAGGLTVVENGDRRAVVELATLDFATEGSWELSDEVEGYLDLALRIDGMCGQVEDAINSYRGCADATNADDGLALANLLPDLGWQGVRLVVVEDDGQWRVSMYETTMMWAQPFVDEPLFTMTSFSWNSPGGWVVLDEASRSLTPITVGSTSPLTPVAAGRIALGVVETGPNGGLVHFDGPGIFTESCYVTLWVQSLVDQDLSEGPDYYEGEYCIDRVGVEVPPDSLVVIAADAGISGWRPLPLDGEITVTNGS